MREWGRATRVLRCGACRNREIKQGEPVLSITFGSVKRGIYRCVDCSGPAPPDLPPSPERKQSGDFSMVQFGQMKPKTRGELKSAAKQWVPTREPGEDG